MTDETILEELMKQQISHLNVYIYKWMSLYDYINKQTNKISHEQAPWCAWIVESKPKCWSFYMSPG